MGGAFYNLEDESRLHQAKATHRETTASTERSARVQTHNKAWHDMRLMLWLQ